MIALLAFVAAMLSDEPVTPMGSYDVQARASPREHGQFKGGSRQVAARRMLQQGLRFPVRILSSALFEHRTTVLHEPLPPILDSLVQFVVTHPALGVVQMTVATAPSGSIGSPETVSIPRGGAGL